MEGYGNVSLFVRKIIKIENKINFMIIKQKIAINQSDSIDLLLFLLYTKA
jgi:hypothetical protein